MFELKGMLPALLTPFDKEGDVNFSVLREMVEWQLSEGVSGFYLTGGTGEGLLMTYAERAALTEAVVAQVKGRVPVVVHIGAMTTRAACELAAQAQSAGADGVSSVPPFYFNVGPEGVKRYYQQVAAASGLPFYIYNVPGSTGVKMSVALVQELIDTVPTLRGMKYTDYDFYTMRQIIELDGGRFNVVSGPDEMMLAAQAMGAAGAIGTTQNLIPRVFVEAYTAFHRGELAHAQALQANINHLVRTFLSFPSHSACKEIMRLRGFDCGAARPPLLPLSDEQRVRLHEMLEEIKFFSWC